MKVVFSEPTNISDVLKFNTGILPRYGKGTMKGTFWCSCGQCVGDIMLLNNNNVTGLFFTECKCGNKINWSEADKYI